ncbi:MAG: prepilin-type N-terminal cleavage/methylation domain-containing protein [Deltaproteobacteria bacterium]|nr:prepilin-type N-terminal cleavage/methylation domain-containing protein [Deltaproteobacteria bacterium]
MAKVRRLVRLEAERGFSLVEMLVAMFISGIVLGSVALVMANHTKSYKSGNDLVGARQNARLALLMIQRDIRAAGSNVFFEKNPLGPVYCDANALDAGRGYPMLSVGGTGVGELAAYFIRRRPPYLPEEIVASPYPMNQTTTNADGSLVNQTLTINRLSGEAFETNSAIHGIGSFSTQTVNLDPNIVSDEQPNPDWRAGTLLLIMGDTESGNMAVVREVTGGGFPAYSVATGGSVYNSNFSIGTVTADEIVAGARMVMEVNRRVQYRLNTTDSKLTFQDLLYDNNPATIMNGIAGLRLFMDTGGGFVPFSPTARPTVIRIEVEAGLPSGKSVKVSGIAEMRNF